jgi:hypothetical protein
MDLWNTETPIREIDRLSIEIPEWIESDISPCDVASIVQGGCASGAYMPACRYSDAMATMAAHGDDVLQYLHDSHGELPRPPDDSSWYGLVCFYLSAAVETWAYSVKPELESHEAEESES